MPAGRPATTVEGQVRSMTKRLASPAGAMDAGVRLEVMETLLRGARTDARFMGKPSRESLIRLAAHAIAWAEEMDDSTGVGA